MGNGTNEITSEMMRDRLSRIVGAYRGLLRADERRLHEAMLQYERSCWAESMQHAA